MANLESRSVPNWDAAQSFVQQIEWASYQRRPIADFMNEFVVALRHQVGADFCQIWKCDRFASEGQSQVVSSDGVRIAQWVDEHHARFDPASVITDAHPVARWLTPSPDGAAVLRTFQPIDDTLFIGVDLHFSALPDLATQQRIAELCEVLLALASTAYVRSLLGEMRHRGVSEQRQRHLISRLYRGTSLADSFASIAQSVADLTDADRVSMFKKRGKRYQLLSTSVQSKIDRRAWQVSVLESIAYRVAKLQVQRIEIDHTNAIKLTAVTESDVAGLNRLRDDVASYVRETECVEIMVEKFSLADQTGIVETGSNESSTADMPGVVMLIERFGKSGEEKCDPTHRTNVQAETRSFGDLHAVITDVQDSIRVAIERDQVHWRPVQRFTATLGRSKWRAAALLCVILLVLYWPITFWVPANGVIVAKQRQHLFAPATGIVDQVHVANGQHVAVGDILITMHSPELQLKRQAVEAELATAQTQLTALMASRSGLLTQPTDGPLMALGAEIQTLETAIAGLQSQLDVIDRQFDDLRITSPMAGNIQGWDLDHTLPDRPVSHGQYLMDVIRHDQGWQVELQVADQNLAYLPQSKAPESIRCTIRVVADPTVLYESRIEQIAESAQRNQRGQSVVRLTSSISPGEGKSVRDGASVVAYIDCGKRSLGFVWFRAAFEWVRGSLWF